MPTINLFHGDCLDVLKSLPESSLDACVTDPPYGLSDHSPEEVSACLEAWMAGKPYLTKNKGGFMGRSWDAWVPGPEVWREVLRVLKPGAHLLCFAGTRSMDLMSMAIRLAGFEMRDTIGNAHAGSSGAPLLAWVYGSGMPKSLNVAKAIDKMLRGDEAGTGEMHPDAAKWNGYGTTLKPAWEPIIIARKPLLGTVAETVLAHGTGGMNIDATRVVGPKGEGVWGTSNATINTERKFNASPTMKDYRSEAVETEEGMIGRHPANVVHDGSDEVMALFDAAGIRKSGVPGVRRKPHETTSMSGRLNMTGEVEKGYADEGSVARFYYCTKASKKERAGSSHPTVKPVELMKWLVRMVVPPDGTVLDPFGGSGTTGAAAIAEGFSATLIERETQYAHDIVRRLGKHMPTPPALPPLDAVAPEMDERNGNDLDALFG